MSLANLCGDPLCLRRFGSLDPTIPARLTKPRIIAASSEAKEKSLVRFPYRTATERQDQQLLAKIPQNPPVVGKFMRIMKVSVKFTLAFSLLLMTLHFANIAAAQTTAPKNLLAGVGGPITAVGSWSNYSALSLIPGAGQFGVTSANTVLYLGFTGGTSAVVSNMVMYKTARGTSKILSVTPVKHGGVSNPVLNISSTTTCPQPLSITNPCIVRLDPTVLALSPLFDYYFVVYFATNTNNQAISGATGNYKTSLSGWYISGDETHLKVGQSIPAGNSGTGPFFLMYVMSN